ncbi:MAG TPA: TadE/TadG family type IV pilus assembly protein, partial [Telluria sp.]
MMATQTREHQHGSFAVEFALILLMLLTLLFGVIELARLMFIYNTLQDATRRAAASAAATDWRDQAAMDLVRQRALFRSSPGELVLGKPVTDAHVRIDYLAIVRDGASDLTMSPIPAGSLPSCHARNRVVCTANPNDAHCIRLVRVRICDPADAATCQPVYYT